MIQILNDVPANVAAFRASGKVTEADYKNVVVPHVKKLTEKTGELNFLLVLDTAVGNFTAGAWLQDALLGIKNLTKWNRSSIITDSEPVIKFTEAFSVVVPGEFKGYKKSEYSKAVAWVSGDAPENP